MKEGTVVKIEHCKPPQAKQRIAVVTLSSSSDEPEYIVPEMIIRFAITEQEYLRKDIRLWDVVIYDNDIIHRVLLGEREV